jgi:hypothetical protein
MKMLFASVVFLVSGAVQAAAPVNGRWEEIRAIPHVQAVEVMASARKAGGECYELPAEKIVVCYYANTAGKAEAN